MSIVKNIACIILAIVAAYLLASFVGPLYCNFFGGCSAGISSVNFAPIIGLMLAYFFLAPFFISLVDTAGKYWWIAAFTVPILAWALYIDVRIMQIMPLILAAVAGLLLGSLVHKLLQKLTPGLTARLSG